MQNTHTHTHTKGWESTYRRGNSSTYLTNHANRGAIIDKEGGRGRRRRRRRMGGGRWWEIHHRHYCLFVSFLTIMHLFFHLPLLSILHHLIPLKHFSSSALVCFCSLH
jgi:hypothetical protein